jgi:3-dehydroquinate synthase
MKISLIFPPVEYAYDIELGNNYFDKIARSIKENFPKKNGILLADSNIKKLYGAKLLSSLEKYNIKSKIISFSAGEKSKSSKIKEEIESDIIKKGFDRSSILLALGGGVTGDLGGYIAATFMRGIPFIQIPTSLLAMVDSSIGGKVAINHPLGKNLIGAFYQPKAVFIDVSTLKTLPLKEYINGLSEIIKTALIKDKSFFSYIVKHKSSIKKSADKEVIKIISKSCKIKANIVMHDEKERGIRKLLNYGHTIGHAIEILSGFTIPHGYSIAIGMNIENIIAYKMGLLKFDEYKSILDTISFFDLPVKIPKKIDSGNIMKKVKVDKKSINGIPYFTLLNGIGNGSINNVVEEKLILETLEEAR